MAKGALADDSKKNLSLLLSGATGTISIEPAHDSARPDARVSFALSESSAARWLDEDGNSGVFNPQRIVSDWDNITDAGRVRLGLALEDGTDRTIIISDVRIRRHNGLIQFIGSLLSVNEAKRIRSVVGAESNIEHRVFVEGISQNGVELAFSDADLFLDTYTLNDYRQTSRGVDRGIPLREILGDRSTDSPLQGRPDKTYQESSDHNQLLPLSTNEPLPYRSTLPGFSQLSEHTIKAAFRYAQKHGTMFSPDDPIFGYDEVMPAGSARQSDQASKGLDGRMDL